MKKKTMAFGGLLMAVAVTAYSVCGTYAKYVSSMDFADEARVAKWDFKLVGEETTGNYDINLFQDSYVIEGTENTKVVSSEPGVKVVAPGTFGKYDFNIQGTAETNYTVDISDVVVENTIKTDTYNPIKFSMDGNTWMTDEELAEALTNSVADKVYPANYVLDLPYSIQWKWDFETEVDGMTREEIDALDTELARKQGTVKVSLKLTVTQSEEAASADLTAPKTTTFAKAPQGAINALKGNALYASLDEKDFADVKFNGKSLMGSIEANHDLDAAFGTGYNTGFYYPIVVMDGEGVAFINNGSNAFNLSDANVVLAPLHPEKAAADQVITIDIYKDATKAEKTGSYTIDYSKINFNN